MPTKKKLITTSLVIGTFVGCVALIYFLAFRQILNSSEAGLMVVALIGLYVGFGILILVYRMVNKLE